LGVPNTGFHTHLIGIAIADVLMTILGGWLISKYMNWNFSITLGGLFLLGIVLHRIFCVLTTIDKLLFP
jgi:hypothetical protein